MSDLLNEENLAAYGYLLLPLAVMQTAGSAAQTVAAIRSHWGLRRPGGSSRSLLPEGTSGKRSDLVFSQVFAHGS